MAGMVTCPSCQRPLQVPEEYVGSLVKCPVCGANFTAAQPRESAVISEGPRQGDEYREDYLGHRDDEAVRGAVAAPAICLIITGCLGLLCSSWWLMGVVNGEVKAAFQQQQAHPDARVREFQKRMAEAAEGGGFVAVLAVFMAVNLSIILGAVAILRRRFYALAVTSSILAMVNVFGCCCVLGLPFGIWSLMVLTRPDVKAAFQ